MKVDIFDFELDRGLIADRPAEPGADSFNAAEAALFKEIIGKRNRQIQNAQVHLNILEHTQDIR